MALDCLLRLLRPLPVLLSRIHCRRQAEYDCSEILFDHRRRQGCNRFHYDFRRDVEFRRQRPSMDYFIRDLSKLSAIYLRSFRRDVRLAVDLRRDQSPAQHVHQYGIWSLYFLCERPNLCECVRFLLHP